MAATLPPGPTSCQPSFAASASSANTPKRQLIASNATDVSQASTACGRFPRAPKTARVNVIVGSPERTPPSDASATTANSSVPASTESNACHTFNPKPSAITPTETKNRFAFVPTQKNAV